MPKSKKIKVQTPIEVAEKELGSININKTNPVGKLNFYRSTFAKGLGGSNKEESWNKETKVHSCCGSKVCWRHKKNCPNLKINKLEVKNEKSN